MQRTYKSTAWAVAGVLLLAGLAMAAQMMSVQVRSGQLREKPSYLGRMVTILPYGDRVNLVAEEGDWKRSLRSSKAKLAECTPLLSQNKRSS